MGSYFVSRISAIILLFIICISTSLFAQETFTRNVTLMGSRFQVGVVADNPSVGNNAIDEAIAEITRIENLISEWIPTTEISKVNQNAGIKPVRVSAEIFELTKRAIAYSQLSDGAFDISIVALDKVWYFDDSMTKIPTPEVVSQSVKNVGYQYIRLDSIEQTVFLEKVGMKIGFGSIGKGYAADKVRDLLEQKGIKGGLMNASGDIATWGSQPNGKSWEIGIYNPFKPHKILKKLKLNRGSLATSGSYEKYVEFNGTRYSHIINPKTGYPAQGTTSVTVVGESVEIANALSTSLMVLGYRVGNKLMKAFPEYKFYFILDTKRTKSY